MAAFDNDDTIRHALIQFATGGRVGSSSQVTAEEVDLVGTAADMLELGDLLLVVDEAGTRVADPDGKWSLPSPEVDWKQVAKDHDTTQAALLRRARQQAIEAGEEAPSKLQQLTPQQTARLLAPAPETTTASAEPQEDPAPPATPAAPAEPEHAADAAQTAAGSVLVVLVRPGGLQQHMVDDTTATEILRLVGAA